MKKMTKKKGLFDYKFNIIIDKRLDDIKPGPNELRRLAEINEHLKKLKFPKEYYEQLEKNPPKP